MAFKCVYMVNRSSYLYNIKNFFPYSMWDIVNTFSYRNNILIVFHRIARPIRQTLSGDETNPQAQIKN